MKEQESIISTKKMINTRSICPNLPNNLSLLIIIIMLLHYATQRHGIEHRARQESHDSSVEFLEQVSEEQE